MGMGFRGMRVLNFLCLPIATCLCLVCSYVQPGRPVQGCLLHSWRIWPVLMALRMHRRSRRCRNRFSLEESMCSLLMFISTLCSTCNSKEGCCGGSSFKVQPLGVPFGSARLYACGPVA